MNLAEEFALTTEERARLDAAPSSFHQVDEDGWRAFAAFVVEQVLKSYADGDIDLRRALEAVRSCSLYCRTKDRIILIALTADRAMRMKEPAPRKRAPNPLWVRNSAATLVSMLHEGRPDEPFAPHEHNRWTTPILEEAIAQLVTLGLCESIEPRTLYKWYRAYKKTATPSSLPTSTNTHHSIPTSSA